MILHDGSRTDVQFETVGGELSDEALEQLASLLLASGEVSGQSDEGDG